MKLNKSVTFVLLFAGMMSPVSSFAQKPNPSTLSRAAITGRTGLIYHVGLGTSPAKQALNTRFIYTEEIRRASQMYQQLSRLSSVQASCAQWQQEIQKNIVNHTLRTNMLRHLEKGHHQAMLNDLASYYHLLPKYLPTFHATTDPEETFARDALDYMRTNPHKPNWALRQVLKTDGVDENLKTEIRDLLKQTTPTLTNTDAPLSLLRTAYRQYLRTLDEAVKSPSVQETLKIYEQLTAEMEVFTTLHNRAPRWQDPQERDLYNRFETLLYQNQTNRFELIIPYLEKLYLLAESFPSPRLGEEDTLRDVITFIQKQGQLPQSVRLREFLTQRPLEPLLYESMLYWKEHSPNFRNKIYSLSMDNSTPYYPVYY